MTTLKHGLDSAASQREVWFQNGDTRLFAVEMGRGHAVVFLHGGLSDHRGALFRLRGVASHCRLICPDLRASGRSVYAGRLSWDLLADDVAALIRHLGLKSAVVGGTSMGSAVAVRFALRHPALLRGLVLMSPVYPGADRPLAEPALAAMRIMGEAGERTLQQGVNALRPLFEGLPEPVRGVALEMMLGFDAASVAATTRFLATNEQPIGSVRELAAIAVPVMVLPGTDAQHPTEVATLYAQHLCHAQTVEQTDPDAIERITRFCRDPAPL